MIIRKLAAVFLLAVLCGQAYAWNYKGHEVVGAIADELLEPNAKEQVKNILGFTITVVKGQPAPLPFSIRDKKEALFLLAHFVGDLHQPLHVGAIYLDRNGQPVNPDLSGLDPLTETAGGNLIRDRYKDHDKDRDEP